MRTRASSRLLAALLMLAGRPALADEGMWLFNQPPLDLLQQRHGFKPDAAWLEHLQKSCVRFSTGGSGSLVSPDGLVMTNHHVASDNIQKLSTPARDLMREGFLAVSRDEELKCEDLELMILWTIQDVTDEVNAGVTADMHPAQASESRRAAMTAIEQQAEKATGLDAQVVTLWQGARHHLYSYRRYTDVRLVFCPEEAAAYFGGDTDNFEYPRFCLDVAFFRIYENGQPLKAEHHLAWSTNGAHEGELALVGGHPGSTQRLNTVDHLRFLRDVEESANLVNLWRREVQAQTFAGRSEEHARIVSGDLLGVQNTRKAVTGVMAGLLDPAIWRAKQDAEAALRRAVASDPDRVDQWGDAWDQLNGALEMYRSWFTRHSALEGRRRAIRSDLFAIARNLVRLADQASRPNAERLREFRDSELDSLRLEMFSPAPIYESLEIDRLANGLTALAQALGGDDPLVVAALVGKAPRQRAVELVQGTSLMDISARRALAAEGQAGIDASTDPMIQLAVALEPESLRLRRKYEDEVESAQHDAYAKIAAARFAIEGEQSYPDATFTLRLSFGPIKGYQEAGQPVPAFTTLSGAFDRMQERGGVEPFRLPDRWLDRRANLKLDTPYNFVCTADIIGGNSGSPAVNVRGEVIGLIFDGNIQSLAADIAYSDQQARAVCVDSRAIIETMRTLYDAGALVDEITASDARARNTSKSAAPGSPN